MLVLSLHNHADGEVLLVPLRRVISIKRKKQDSSGKPATLITLVEGKYEWVIEKPWEIFNQIKTGDLARLQKRSEG